MGGRRVGRAVAVRAGASRAPAALRYAQILKLVPQGTWVLSGLPPAAAFRSAEVSRRSQVSFLGGTMTGFMADPMLRDVVVTASAATLRAPSLQWSGRAGGW